MTDETMKHEILQLTIENHDLREALEYIVRESKARKGNLKEWMEVIHDEARYALQRIGVD